MKVKLSPGHPLTLAQRDIYFHQLHQPESAMYNIGGYLVLEDADLAALERAHSEVIEHHDAFGIRIHASTEGVQQWIATERDTTLVCRDFSTQAEPEKAARAWLSDVFQMPFPLYDQELYKTFLLKVSPNKHWYVGVVHHLMMDGWGFTNWARELDRLYQKPEAQPNGSDLSWAQIVAEDQAYANSSKFERDRAYWQETMPVAPERLLEPHYRADFPANKPIPSQRETRFLPSGTMEALKKLSEDTKLSLPSLFLTMLATYFAGEKRRNSLVFGLPVHNRRGRKQKRMLGVFTGISPFVMACSKESRFVDLGHQIQASLKTHFRHQRYPIGRLTRDLGMAGSDQLLYDVCFNFLKLDNPFEDETTPSSLHYLSNSQEPTPLTLTLWQVGDDRPIEMQAEFNHAYFKVEEIRLLLDRLLFLMEQICQTPTLAIDQFSLIPAREEAMMQTWQGEKLDFDPTLRVHQLFEAQAKAHPERIALYHEGTQLSYADLNQRSHAVAHALVASKLGPQHLVGLYLSRGPEMVIAMLGAMKAGVPYVPLDPNYPESRLRIMLQAGRVACVLTETKLQKRIEAEGIPTLLVGEACQQVHATDQPLPDHKILGTSHHAYVLFTSGSTGKPKGVAISHANVSAMIHWGQSAFSPEELEQVLLSTSLNFDISVFEVFLPLCSGKSGVIVENALALFEKTPRPPVTLINTVPSAIRALLEHGAVPPSARVVNLAGEALPQDTVNQLLHLVPKVFNLYGPTEDTTYSTVACFQETLTATPVIGRPIANSQALVLGPDLKAMPVGAVGELFLAGAGVTRGYVNRTAETASRFIPNPTATGQRMYRTGDLVRWLPHGQLQFLGRFDDQIKLRGFRIELQEIVAQLLNLDIIKDAAVVVRGQQEKQSLVAYVVLTPEGQAERNQATASQAEALPDILRQALRDNLPEYMVPAAFVTLEKMPLTPNGKINRQALPEPEREHLTVATHAAMPRTPVERQLQAVWQEILQTSPIGIHDNFFELGGDSILAIQIMTKAHQRGLHLAPGDLFKNPSIAALAEVTRGEKLEILGTQPDSGPITPLPIQQWFLESGMAEPAHYNQSVLLEVDATVTSEDLREAFQTLHRQHDALRLRFDIAGLEPIHYTDTAEVFFESQAFQDNADALADWIFARTNRLQRSLNLKEGPLVAAGHYELAHQETNLLFIAIHHLVVDGVSWRILLEDFTAILKSMALGKSPQLPEKTTSLGAWSAKLSESRGNLFYWLNWPKTVQPATFRAFADGTTTLGNLFAGNTETLTLQLDPSFTQSLIKHPAAIYRLGVQEVLLTALGRTLANTTERWDMMFDLESHGREQGLFDNMDLSRTVGWFTAIYPFRLTLQAEGEPEDDLLAIKACMHEVPRKGLFFDPERTNTPQAAILFNYLGRFETTLQPPFMGHSSYETGASLSPLAKRRHLLEIDAMLLKDGLQMTWTFCSNHLKRAQVESVAIAFQSQLDRLVKHCAKQEQRRLAPSDFPLAALDQKGVDSLVQSHRDIADIYPLSPVQEGMLFHALYGERKEAYFEQLTCRFEGALDFKLYQRAWNDMIAETPALATAFAWEQSGQPLQIIQNNPVPHWHQEDLTHLTEHDQKEFLARFLISDRQAGFALDQGPLIRFALFKTTATSWAFVWSYHHLLMDGWSMSLVLDEVLGHYRALIGGGDFLREQRPPFRNFIARARNQDLAEARRFWREHLAGFEAPLVLPIQRGASRPQIAHVNRTLPNHVLAELQTVGKAHEVTLSTCIQAAWGILLARYCHTRDVVFGLTVSGRETGEEDLTQTIGLLINTVPVRIVFEEDQTLKACLAELQTQTIARERHGGLPQADIQACSGLTGGQELFDYLLVVENYPLDPERLHHGLGFEITDVGASAFTHYGLTVVARAHDGLHFQIAYDTGKFASPAVERLLDQLQTLLEALPSALSQSFREPQKAIKPLDLPLLDRPSQQQLTHTWNQVAVPSFDSGGIHQRFEAQAAAHPHREALVLPAHKRLDGVDVPAQSLTYSQLNHAANRLAMDLRQRGAGPETLVGLHVERSLEMVIGILGILKSGAAYVPLDPVYPSERLAFITADAQLAWVICQKDMDDKLPAGSYQRIPLEVDLASTEVFENPEPPPTIAAQTAYIIYTSGSTGKPKGVPVTHNNVVRLFETSDALFGFNETDTWTLFHSYAFDFTVWELWGSLTYGGRLVIVPQIVARSAESFHQLLVAHEVSVLNQTPSAFVRLIQADEHAAQRLDALRFVIFGGEALEPQSLIPWFAKYGDATPQLINMYGITETTVHVTYGPIGKVDCETGGSNLGVRLPDLSLFLLDAKLRPVPLGAKGEIFVGGGGVARGYLHQPALTAQRFVPHPFATQPGARLYRSGDLGRFRDDAFMDMPILEYAGRCDFQVKIRGYRIELGEIEAALLGFDAVRDAIVLAREDLPAAGGKQLVAYLAGNQEQIPSAETMHQELMKHLPDYMIPAHFVVLESLPLTAHGKVDRRKLPRPDEVEQKETVTWIAPTTPVEKQLAAIWSQVLDLDKVSIRQRFFELGGDSILSIRVMTAAKRQGILFTLPQLFELQTIEKLAKVVTQNDASQATDLKPFALIEEDDRAKLPAGIQNAYPATLLQKGMLFHAEKEKDAYHNLTSFHLNATYNEDFLVEAIRSVIARHDVLRTAFDLSRFREPLQLVHEKIKIAISFTDWRHLDPATQDTTFKAWFETEKLAFFDWSEPGLLRFNIQRRGEASFQFTLTEHHAILDGWSVASLFTEIFRYYFARLQGQTPEPTPLPKLGFADFVALEKQTLATPDTGRFWADHLDGFEFTRIPRYPNRDADPAHLDVPLPAEVSAKVLALAEEIGVPLKAVLLAVHYRVLALLTGQDDVLTGLVSNGRPEEEGSERVLGLFLNTLPLRYQMRDLSWVELARDIFALERQTLPHRRYPLAEIQKMFGGKAFFETAFNYTHFHIYQTVRHVPGLELVDTTFYAPTHVPFAANFSRDLDNGKVLLSLDYRADTFPHAQAQDIAGYYQTALAHLVTHPNNSSRHIDFLRGGQRDQVLVDWNQTQVPRAGHDGLHHLVVDQASKTPEKTAIVALDQTGGRRSLSFAELDAQSSQLAHWLLQRGARQDQPIALCLERSPEAIVAILATLKAGCAYVPLDPAYPDDRLAFMIEDSGSTIAIAQQAHAPRLTGLSQVVDLDADADQIQQQSEAQPAVKIHPENAAYVIYTSGSTGTPKGVVISHRAILNQMYWRQQVFNLAEDDRMLQNLSLSFDPSVWQIFWPLSIGAQIYLIPNAAQRDIPWLAKLMLQHRLAAIAMVPSVLRVLLEEEAFLACDHLKHISCGGEGLPADLVTRFCEHFGEEGILHVVYGPTEATIDASTWHARKQVPTRIAPIGLPIHNAQLYVLDSAMQAVPPGVPGELYIAGDGLGRGYLNRAGLTGDRYVPNPFDRDGSRLYKSGDQVRYLKNGLLEFLGRVDHQVKVRGFRIELGELEAILAEHPQIDEVACLVREDQPGDKRLVAYLRFNGEPEMTPRRWMADRVPDYMVPAVFVTLEDFPRLPNDKINRQRLPKPEATDRQTETAFTPPQTAVQKELAAIWSTVLDLERVGIHDNFFELGGDSILSLQIIARAREVGLELSPKHIFENQTISSLAEVAAAIEGVRVEQGPLSGSAPVSPFQENLLNNRESVAYQAVLLNIPFEWDSQQLERCLNQLCRHHDSLRLFFEKDHADAWLQTYGHSDLEMPFRQVLSEAGPSERAALIEMQIKEAQATLIPNQAPLFRAIHFQFNAASAPPEAKLYLIAHPLVMDRDSWGILLQDLALLWNQGQQEALQKCPPKTSALSDWTQKLQELAKADVDPETIAFWQAQQTTQPLALDHPDKALEDSAPREGLTFRLSREQTEQLQGPASAAYQTGSDDLLLTALTLAWQEWQHSPLSVERVVSSRDQAPKGLDLSRSVGCFNVAYPVRLQTETTDLDKAIKAVKQQLKGMVRPGYEFASLELSTTQDGAASDAIQPAQVRFHSSWSLPHTQESPFEILALSQSNDGIKQVNPKVLLEWDQALVEGALEIRLSWPSALLEKARVNALLEGFRTQLEKILDHCLQPQHGGRTPADFPLVSLNQTQVDALVENGVGIEDVMPLAPTQQDILFHVVYREGALFHQQLHLVIEQAIDVARFQEAWHYAIHRHMGLRTSFHWQGLDRPVQLVHEHLVLPWELGDWRDLQAQAQQERLTAHLAADRKQPFDSSKPPLMRFGLFQLDAARYQFVWSHHFLLSDGWSLPLILKDVLAYYFEEISDLSAMPSRSFRDYLSWIHDQDLDAAKTWWRDMLKGFREPTPLPYDRLVEGEGGSSSHGKVHSQLSLDATERLKQFAKQQRLTVNTLVQGAWALVLGYHSHAQDVLFGSSVSGRPAEISGIGDMVGLFINTLPVRAPLDPNTNIASWLHALQDAQQERESRSTTPALVIRGESEVAADQPLYESIVVFENFPVDPALLDRRFEFSNWVVEEQTNFPLSLTAELNDAGLMLDLTYHTVRFQRDLVTRMLAHFEWLLEQLETQYQRRLGDIEHLSEEHKQAMLSLGCERQFPLDTRSLHHLVEASASATPQNTAVVALVDGIRQRLSYQELNQRAEALALHLVDAGIGPEDYVGIFLDKCLELPIAILAVLKAGAAFVPLSPEYPVERLASMASQANLAQLLTKKSFASIAPSTQALQLHLDGSDIDWQRRGTLPLRDDRNHPAYLIFSSGSTGKPKGITVSHGSIVNAARAWEADYQLRERCQVHLQMAAFSFDVFVGDFARALTTSATLVLCPKEILLEPQALLQLIQDEHVDGAEFVPAVMRELATHLESTKQDLSQFRLLVVGSDAWSMQELSRVRALCGPETRLINSYGVTEAAVDSTYLEETQLQLAPERMVPIGRAYHNTRPFVLNRNLDAVAMGVTGLLFIGGPGLARCYHNNPRATAEKFVPNPYGESGDRLYRTDDSARILPDGQIDFLGRIDHQIKLRGLRIELGEIEAALLACEGVAQAVVILREDGPTNLGPQLCAYIVNSEARDSDSLRGEISRNLPDYMVPAFFIALESLPLAPNGKVDRRHLPAPDWEQFNFGRTTPETDTERILAKLWADTLGRDIPSMEANFFQLGGHSLLATRLISYIRDQFKVELPLRILFESPTIALMAAALDDAQKRSADSDVPLVKTDAEPILSFGQKRLWFINQMVGTSAAYNLGFGLHLQGDLNRGHLEQAILMIVERHESLRSSMGALDGKPQLVINPTPTSWHIPFEDLSGSEDVAGDTQSLFTRETGQPFDLKKDSLLRLRLVRLGPDEHLFIVTMHHIISDAWSIGVMISELSMLYTALSKGETPYLPAMELQYSDYAHWQQAYLSEGRLEAQLKWWKTQLQDAPPSLDLPFDRNRSAVRQTRGASFEFALGKELTEKIRAMAEETGTTLFMNLIGAYAILLGRYSRSDDLVIGTPIANRTRAELEPMIGFFVNTLAMRFGLNQGSWREHLSEIREMTLSAYENQDLPFERLVEALDVPRDGNHEPVFQVMFMLQNAFTDHLELPGLQVTAKTPPVQEARFELYLALEERETGLHGFWEYNCDLFNRETVEHMARQYRNLLEQLTSAPDQSIQRINFTTAAQRKRLIEDFQKRLATPIKADSVAALIEAQVTKTPQLTAIVADDLEISYESLNTAANQLAHTLREKGVGLENAVAIVANRSAEAIIGQLAVLKAGGWYLPIDPQLPDERISYMLQDANPAILLAKTEDSERFASFDLETIALDSRESWSSHGENLASVSHSEATAYAMFTSGSTGQPKGVAITQKALLSLIDSPDYLDVQPGDAVLHFASLAFDATTFEIWLPLAHGGKICIYPQKPADVEELCEFITHHQISSCFLTTGFFNSMVEHGVSSLTCLQNMLTGGQALSSHHGRLFSEALPDCALINGYGPTECTTFITNHTLRPKDFQGRLPIGKPISHRSALILDKTLQLTSPQITGELFAAGPCLARGYLNKPGLTAKVFLPNPFAATPGARLYATGDLAFLNTEEEIIFCGREDDQVKIRGFRIETGEIEERLLQHEHIHQAAVIPRKDLPGGEGLVAFITSEGDVATLDATLISSFLKKTLPDFMVPALFIPLEAMPLNRNGKIDRNLLARAPLDNRLGGQSEQVAPRTDLEKQLAGIWEDILQTKDLSIHDNFFEVGGHSLLATQIVSRIRSSFGVETPLSAFFETPTIAQLAHLIENEAGGHSLPGFEPSHGGETFLELSHGQRRLWFLNKMEPDHGRAQGIYNISTVIEVEGQLDLNGLQKALTQLEIRHQSLRTNILEEQGRPIQVIRPNPQIKIIYLDATELPADQWEAHVGAEATRNFNLASEPLLRLVTVKQAEDHYQFIVTMHHIISDGWSLNILVRELLTFYREMMGHGPAALPPLPMQYSEYARWQQLPEVKQAMSEQAAWWKDKLAHSPICHELPTDRPRPPVQTHRGGYVPMVLDAQTMERLKALAQKSDATMFMVLLAGFKLLLSRYSGQSDILVGSPIAGRNRAEIEPLIGMFVNTLVMRSFVDEALPFETFLHQVRKTALEAYAHQEVPFEQVVDTIQPPRNLGHAPLFQIMFVMQTQGIPELEMENLKLTTQSNHAEIAKFDLTLDVQMKSDGLLAKWEYNTDLFDRATIQNMANHFVALLKAIPDHAQHPMDHLDFLDPSERLALQLAANQTHTQAPLHLAAHQLFENQAANQPNQLAILGENTRMSYADLNARANQIAWKLVDAGITADSQVAVFMERSWEMVAGILAVLKSGASYLSLDTHFPQQRIETMLADSEPRLVLTKSAYLDQLAGQKTLCLDSQTTFSGKTENLNLAIDSDQAAYLIYTSGSTGKPKASINTHRGLVNHVLWLQDAYPLRGTDRVGFRTPLNFDVATREIFWPLTSGATLAMAKPGTQGDPSYTQNWIVTQDISVIYFVGSMLKAFLDHLEEEALSSKLRLLFTGGETLPPAVQQHALALLSNREQGLEMISTYGPSEAAISSTSFYCGTEPMSDLIPLGKPIDNMTAYIVDRQMRLAPQGVPGELVLGGAGLSRGYLNRAGLTGRQFIPNPFAGEIAGQRLYRTGDLARRLPSGDLQFLGRMDGQIKLRGLRVELGEINAQLHAVPKVVAAEALISESSRGEQALVAFIQSKDSHWEELVDAAKAHLKAHIPAFMVPNFFVPVDQWPRLPSGKVNKKVLLELGQSHQALLRKSQYTPPRNDIEESIVGIWQQVLGLEQVGVFDNFFEIGGHSLLATQVHSRLSNMFPETLSLQFLFEEPTIAGIADAIEGLRQITQQHDTSVEEDELEAFEF